MRQGAEEILSGGACASTTIVGKFAEKIERARRDAKADVGEQGTCAAHVCFVWAPWQRWAVAQPIDVKSCWMRSIRAGWALPMKDGPPMRDVLARCMRTGAMTAIGLAPKESHAMARCDTLNIGASHSALVRQRAAATTSS